MSGARLPVGRGAGRARGAGHQEDRGRHRRRQRRQAHDLDRHRRLVGRRPSSSAWRSTRTARSTTSRTPSRASAPSCRAPSTSRSSSASTSRACRSSPTSAARAGHDARAALLVRRRRRHARAAGREGRRRRSSAIGGVDREIRVALDPDRLLAYGITAGDVNRQLRATNVDLAGGRGEIGGREQAIRTLAGKQSVADLAATMIMLPRRPQGAPRPARARVDRRQAEPRTFAALNGSPWWRSPSRAPKEPATRSVAADVAKKSRSCRRTYPDVELKLIDDGRLYARHLRTRP